MNRKHLSLTIAVVTMLLVLSMALSSCVVPPASETTEGTSEQTTEQTTQASETSKHETTETVTESSAETTGETTETITESSEEGTTESATESSIDTTETVTESSEGTSEDITESDTEPSTETTEETTANEITETTAETSQETTETETEPSYTISIEGMDPVITAHGGSYSLVAPEKEGYFFMGWVTENGTPFAAQGVISEDVSISPVFERLTTTGLSFSSDERVYMTESLDAFPITAGFRIKLDPNLAEGKAFGILMSNSIYWGPSIAYEINASGNPVLVVDGFKIWDAPKEYRRSSITSRYTFNDVALPRGEVLDLYFVIDRQAAKAHCYVNGELKQTVSISKIEDLTDDSCYKDKPFVIGGSNLGSNYMHFNGEIYNLAVWSDLRTEGEMAAGFAGSPEIKDTALLAQYTFYNTVQSLLFDDLSGNEHKLSRVRLWLDKSEVEDVEIGGGYTFAVIGDTQTLVNKYPDKTPALYEWILSKKETYNIQFVMGLGDITETASQANFDVAWQSISKLSGKIPYTIVTGNHDKDDFYSNDYIAENPLDYKFNKVFFNETYLQELDGYFADGDVRSSYTTLDIGSAKWLIVNIDFGATDDMIEWAKDVVEQHPDRRTIIITHAYLYRDGTTLDSEECYAPSRYTPIFNDGDTIFDRLVSQYENIEMVLAGHDPHDHVVCSQITGIHGNTITQMLIDPQYMDNYYGATGMVALLHFSEDGNTVTVRYYSTAKDMYGSELSQFTVNLKTPDPKYQLTYKINIKDMDPVLTAPGGSYSITAPKKEGYTFIGWVTESGESFAAEGVISNDISVSPVFEKLTDTGLKFSSDERIYMTEILSGYPTTVGFTLKINEELPLGEWYGVLLSNSIRWGYHLQYQINELRQPSVNFGYVYENATGLRYFSAKAYHFDQITLPIGEEFDLYFVIDRDNGKIHCYFNGELAQTLDKNSAVSKYKVDTKYFESAEMYSKNPFVIGGNTTGSNYLHFRGEMLSMSVWSDARTDAEIATGGVGSPETNDPNLLAKYKFYNTVNSQLMVDLSGKGHDLESEKLWMSTSEVSKPTDYDYCFAVVGDTQSLTHKNPSAVLSLYDWIANNSAANKHNIKYVLGLGDITENAQVWEWELAKLCFSKLNGKMIPYMMAIGNHDKYDFKNDQDNYIPANRQDFLYNQYLTSNEYYMNNLTGYYGEGDVTSAYTIVTLGSTKWLIMTLDFGPTDDMLEWASDVIGAEENQDCKVIITTHAYLYRDGTTIDVENDDCYAPSKYNSAFNDGDGIFDKLINKHSNIVLVLSGHDPHDHIVCEQIEREDGSVVTQMLIDPQYMDNFYGATGMVALLYYKEDTNQLTVRYYSTVKGMYGSELSQFTVYLD